MLAKKLQQVRFMTERISEFVEAFNIEGCHQLIQQRLLLLEEIQSELASSNDEAQKKEFFELLTWLEQADKEPHQKAVELKKSYQEKLTKQQKTNFAIKQYTSL